MQSVNIIRRAEGEHPKHPYKKGSIFTFFLGSERWSNGVAKSGEKGQGRHVRSEALHTARDAGCQSWEDLVPPLLSLYAENAMEMKGPVLLRLPESCRKTRRSEQQDELSRHGLGFWEGGDGSLVQSRSSKWRLYARLDWEPKRGGLVLGRGFGGCLLSGTVDILGIYYW
ncbi:exostosin family domain containing protein [Musa troglodytarum]|uniref:Exostosin family domain containing protein n=1 Tax=Musa troglodytarum TaxID=320322 RepID=A0A9E7KCS7_9LILI|nr:exostosin family domain containing protein [Musa troglodytarum]URE15548.1 exostosin family domain containing protein [Musa troglodytarum]